MSATASDGFKVEWREYSPRKPSSMPVIFILPPTGGVTILDRRYARALCRRGRLVLIVETWTNAYEQAYDFDLHNRFFGRASRALSILAEKYPGPIDVLGTSVGALFGISALSRIPSVQRAVLITGGVPFTEIIARSDTRDMIHLREERAKKFFVNGDADYVARLNSVFQWNDLDRLNGGTLPDKKIMLVVGEKDAGVPTANQHKLIERFPHAKVIRHNNGHLMTIVKSFLWDFKTIIKFLDN